MTALDKAFIDEPPAKNLVFFPIVVQAQNNPLTFSCGEFDRLQDFRVAGAAAKISRQGLPDLVAARVWILIQQCFRGKENSRNAITALRRPQVSECILQRMRFAIPRHPFHGRDLGIDRLDTEHQTGKYRLAVHEHRASAALTQFAAMFGPGEIHVLTQDLQQCLVYFSRDFVHLVVNAKAHENFAGRPVVFGFFSWVHLVVVPSFVTLKYLEYF